MDRKWWKEAVVYQIYPRSFMDSNGDGIGDIPGIISRLDYLQDLGVDVVWLSPVYESPNVDNGYDISNYKDIMQEFGTLKDLENLIREMHKRNIKLVMDLIVNHTSDQHPWFVEARKSRDNPYHDYYIWKDGEEDSIPNNWESHFSGSAWTYDKGLDQYYLHIFASQQPDLNWENAEVRRDVKDICRFWLDKGVDGFRMDVINFISKVPGYPSVPDREGLVRGHDYYMNGPRVHAYLQELVADTFTGYNIMTVGETPNVTPDIALDYVGENRKELNMVFQFEHMLVDSADGCKWNLVPMNYKKLKKVLSKWQTQMKGGWNSLYLSNHDQPRSVSRFGNDKNQYYHDLSAKILATMLHTLQGTPYIYQGEELGMTNIAFEEIGQYRDIQTLNYYKDQRARGVPSKEIMAKIHYRSRDNARTPMQWNNSENGGFTKGKPWIDINPDYKEINAGDQLEDPDSIFHYYQLLISLRKHNPVVIYGDFQELYEEIENIYAYKRQLDSVLLYVFLNFTEKSVAVELPWEVMESNVSVYISNYKNTVVRQHLMLRPYEATAFITNKQQVY